MYQQMKMAKQMMDLQKASFGGMINGMLMFLDQTDRMVGNLLDQSPWVPEEGKKMFREWIASNIRGCETFKSFVDDGFNKLETSFSKEK